MPDTSIPRLLIAGLSGDSGKTLVWIGLLLAVRDRGADVRAFKKGPDYIDAAWLSWASGHPARNLDTFLAPTERVVDTFCRHAARGRWEDPGATGRLSQLRPHDTFNLVEANRGLFDGMNGAGTHSSAVLAKALGAPVVLVLNVRKMTATAAACVLGCRAFDPSLHLAGVILNNVGGARHEAVVREAIGRIGSIPVVGAIPTLEHGANLPGRHLGLLTPREHPAIDDVATFALDAVRRYVDVGLLLEMARLAPALVSDPGGTPALAPVAPLGRRVEIGYLSDSAFSFYYPENLEALEARGAALVPVSSLEGRALPAGLHAVYIGGGFPETHADALASNHVLLASLRSAAGAGLPIYAECGGLMLLAKAVLWRGRRHEMAGVFPIDVEMCDRPQGHGYTALTVDRANPFFTVGQKIKGHEFHYSRPASHVGGPQPDGSAVTTACAVDRGSGCGGARDALVTNNVWASYTHVHALGLPEWADGVVAAARRFAAQRETEDVCQDSKS